MSPVTNNAVLQRTAPAKINLTLRMTGVRNDGYHLLESLVVFADVGDSLKVSPAHTLMLRVDGRFADGVPTDGRNLVLKAAELLRNLRGLIEGAAITLTKSLPHGAGIGGGSSDAAAAIHLLAELWQVAPLSPDEALPLGADVPVCLCAPHATEMRGIGEDLRPAPYQPRGWLVLVNPGVVVPTRDVFALHDRLYPFSPPDPEPMDHVKDADDFKMWLARGSNDLTKVASEDTIAPIVQDILTELRPAAIDTDMSGSGSTCWALFADQASAEAVAKTTAANHPDWWVQAARILP